MVHKSKSIRQKLLSIIWLACGATILLTCFTFFLFESVIVADAGYYSTRDRALAYGVIAILVSPFSLLLVYVISRQIKREISNPILELTETARSISVRHGYADKEVEVEADEVSLLAKTFNRMLVQLEEKNHSLHEAESRVRAIINSTISAVIVMSTDGRIADWNPQAEKMFGWTREEALGKELTETIIPQRLREAHRKGLQHFLATGEAPVMRQLLEITALRRNGDEFPVELFITTLGTGETMEFCGFITDITERKLAAEQFRMVVESAPNALLLVDQHGRIVLVNSMAERLFGYARTELVGAQVEMLVPHHHRKEHAHFRGDFLHQPEARAMGAGRDLFGQRKDGTEFPVEIGLTPIQIQREVFVLGSVIDITERKLAEEALSKSRKQMENIVQGMGDAYLSLDKDWRYLFVNDKAVQLMNKSTEELIGKTLWEVFPDVVGTTFETSYQKVMNERVPVSFETYYPSSQMWLEVRAYPHEEGIAIFYTNVTKYKKAEEAIMMFNQKLEQMVKDRTLELESVNKELEAFSYSVSHDLRAPLRAIHGYMNIFSEDYASRLDGEAARIMNIIVNNALKMGQLIDDLLTFSRLSRKELMKVTLSMKQIVTAVWDDLRKLERDRQFDFIVHELPEAYADSVSILQVWTNLISNAIKYTRRRERAIIEIGFQEIKEEHVYYIKDNGSGFDMRYYDKLFGVFQRLHSQAEFEGTGVGLAIVHRIIVKHGGRIWAEAQPNKGSAFYFSLNKRKRSKYVTAVR